MSTPRRHFLELAGAGLVAHGLAPWSGDDSLPVNVDSEWDTTWTERIGGKLRAVFDLNEIGHGSGFYRSVMVRENLIATFGVKRSQVGAVIVFRGTAIHLLLDDEYWRRFEIGKEHKVEAGHDTGRWFDANPIATNPRDAAASIKEYAVDAFIASGGIVIGCNVAFASAVSKFRKADNLTREAAEKTARAHLLPGVILQPTGLVALVAAQARGCGYVPST